MSSLNCDCRLMIPPGVECHTVGDAVPFLELCAMHSSAVSLIEKATEKKIVCWLRDAGEDGIANAIEDGEHTR